MKTILIKRVAFITLIFGIFGGALTYLLKIQEMKTYYPALAPLVALLVSLLVSYLIIGKRGAKIRARFKLSATILFILFIAATVAHTYKIVTQTFGYREFDGEYRYVKGLYSPMGMKLKETYPELTDEDLLEKKLGGVDGIKILWTKESVDQNVFMLIISYSGIVLFFAACITILTELLSEEKAKKKIRVKEASSPKTNPVKGIDQ